MSLVLPLTCAHSSTSRRKQARNSSPRLPAHGPRSTGPSHAGLVSSEHQDSWPGSAHAPPTASPGLSGVGLVLGVSMHVSTCVCVCWLLAGTSCWREREAKGHTAEEVATSSPLHTSRHPGHPFWVTNWQRGRVTVPHTSSRVLLGLAQPTKHPSLPPHRELTPARCPRSPGLKT